jgi:hypothetical protein
MWKWNESIVEWMLLKDYLVERKEKEMMRLELTNRTKSPSFWQIHLLICELCTEDTTKVMMNSFQSNEISL